MPNIIRSLELVQPPDVGAKPEEVAEVFVNGQVFTDWESVWVQHRWKEDQPRFRFTCAERDPIPGLWGRLQFRPGDLVTIKLGGVVAVTGVITVRQTAYEGNSHGVSFQGVGIQWFAWRGAILNDKKNFYGSYFEVAEQVLEPFKSKPKQVGNVDATPFEGGVHPSVGETVWDFLERLARDRKVVLGSDSLGNILIIGDHTSRVIDSLVESENILSCQCVISIGDIYEPQKVQAQKPRSDEGSPPDAANQEAIVHSTVLKEYSPRLTQIGHPVATDYEVRLRAETERQWSDATLVEATVIVYGWFTRGGELWEAGQGVMLYAPMTTFDGVEFAIRSVTFTQDRQSGTRTTLDIVAPWLLDDYGFRASETGGEDLTSPTLQPNALANPMSPPGRDDAAVTTDPQAPLTPVVSQQSITDN
jgi:prophage tail gpP-like protein